MPTTEIKRILVGLDGSPGGAQVLDIAISLARKHTAKIFLFRSVGIPMEIPREVWKLGTVDLTQHLKQQAIEYLQGCASITPPELLSHHAVDVEFGSAWRAICTAAEMDKADLIVIGSHGYGGFERAIGTTAAKIVNHAPCSVLVVRPLNQTKT